jgi:hypothetical protein
MLVRCALPDEVYLQPIAGSVARGDGGLFNIGLACLTSAATGSQVDVRQLAGKLHPYSEDRI